MTRVLFSGYAPVHVLCFLPVYKHLAEDSGMEVFFSGGYWRKPDDLTFQLDGFYDPFPVDRAQVIPVEQTQQEDFDVLVCAHLSDRLFPRSARQKVQIFHGVSFKNLAVREKALRYDVLCIPGRYHAEQFEAQGLVRRDGPTCLLTGFPKSDALVSEETNRDQLLAGLGLDPARPTILFAPTGEKDNALEVMGEDVVTAIAAERSWNLLIKPHDHPKNDVDWFERLQPFESDYVRLVRDLDIIPYLRSSDLLITDASSVATEFTLLDRPILFLDVPQLFKRVAKRSPALDLETHGRKIGELVEKPADLVAAITDALADPMRQTKQRRAMACHVFHAPGGAAWRVAGVIRHAAGLTTALPEGVNVIRPECRSAASA